MILNSEIDFIYLLKDVKAKLALQLKQENETVSAAIDEDFAYLSKFLKESVDALAVDHVADPIHSYLQNQLKELRSISPQLKLSPRGFWTVVLDGPHQLFTALQIVFQLRMTLNGGNFVFEDSGSYQQFFKFLNESPHLHLYFSCTEKKSDQRNDLVSFLCEHPGVNGVLISGSESLRQKCWPKSLSKTVSYWGPLKNNLIFVTKPESERVFDEIIERSCLFDGKFQLAIHRIYFPEAEAEFYKDQILKAIERRKKSQANVSINPLQEVSVAIQIEVQNDKGHILSQSSDAPVVAWNLPQCSQLQQVAHIGPMLVLSGYKYFADVVKWTSNSEYAGFSSIYSEPDFFQRNAGKLSSRYFVLNKVFLPKQFAFPGNQASGGGQTSISSTGPLWSFVKELTSE